MGMEIGGRLPAGSSPQGKAKPDLGSNRKLVARQFSLHSAPQSRYIGWSMVDPAAQEEGEESEKSIFSRYGIPIMVTVGAGVVILFIYSARGR